MQKVENPLCAYHSDIPNGDSLSYIGPELYHSGYLSAHLFNYSMKKNSKVLIVNIAKEIDNEHYLLKKEEGFRAYFKDNLKK